jgi:mono/diheme cytochrome c family protein
MRTLTTVAVTLGAAVAALGVGAGIFIESGAYNIGADDHHTKPVFALLETLRERSIQARAGNLDVPDLSDPDRLRRGARIYAANCSSCHVAPGIEASTARRGMYPRPPNLAEGGIADPRTAFWVIKHGIKMSAMPTWSHDLSDDAIWDVVALLRQLPDLPPTTFGQWVITEGR